MTCTPFFYQLTYYYDEETNFSNLTGNENIYYVKSKNAKDKIRYTILLYS